MSRTKLNALGRYQVRATKIDQDSDLSRRAKETLAARGLEEHVQITLIFSRIISFMLFTVLLSHMYFFKEFLIHNSCRGFMILKNN